LGATAVPSTAGSAISALTPSGLRRTAATARRTAEPRTCSGAAYPAAGNPSSGNYPSGASATGVSSSAGTARRRRAGPSTQSGGAGRPTGSAARSAPLSLHVVTGGRRCTAEEQSRNERAANARGERTRTKRRHRVDDYDACSPPTISRIETEATTKTLQSSSVRAGPPGGFDVETLRYFRLADVKPGQNHSWTTIPRTWPRRSVLRQGKRARAGPTGDDAELRLVDERRARSRAHGHRPRGARWRFSGRLPRGSD
jgi:hypothetical protein